MSDGGVNKGKVATSNMSNMVQWKHKSKLKHWENINVFTDDVYMTQRGSLQNSVTCSSALGFFPPPRRLADKPNWEQHAPVYWPHWTFDTFAHTRARTHTYLQKAFALTFSHRGGAVARRHEFQQRDTWRRTFLFSPFADFSLFCPSLRSSFYLTVTSSQNLSSFGCKAKWTGI